MQGWWYSPGLSALYGFHCSSLCPFCRHLESLPDVKPQLYADNLECSAERPRALFESARFTAQYSQWVRMCLLVSVFFSAPPSRLVRKAMKLWDISGDGVFWKVQLDVRDLGGHLDFTFRARAGTLSKRVGEATVGVASSWCFTFGFSGQIGAGSWKVSPCWPPCC